jgi:hypothetical protein
MTPGFYGPGPRDADLIVPLIRPSWVHLWSGTSAKSLTAQKSVSIYTDELIGRMRSARVTGLITLTT